MKPYDNTLEINKKLTHVSARSLYRGQKNAASNLPCVQPYPAIAATRVYRFGEVSNVVK